MLGYFPYDKESRYHGYLVQEMITPVFFQVWTIEKCLISWSGGTGTRPPRTVKPSYTNWWSDAGPRTRRTGPPLSICTASLMTSTSLRRESTTRARACEEIYIYIQSLLFSRSLSRSCQVLAFFVAAHSYSYSYSVTMHYSTPKQQGYHTLIRPYQIIQTNYAGAELLILALILTDNRILLYFTTPYPLIHRFIDVLSLRCWLLVDAFSYLSSINPLTSHQLPTTGDGIEPAIASRPIACQQEANLLTPAQPGHMCENCSIGWQVSISAPG